MAPSSEGSFKDRLGCLTPLKETMHKEPRVASRIQGKGNLGLDVDLGGYESGDTNMTLKRIKVGI